MQWIKNYHLFLFDFDGLLVNTEELHFQAYFQMCAQRDIHLDWSFERYSHAAHHSATGLRDQIYADFPLLCVQEPNWSILYEEKKQAFLKLLQQGAVQLMPGAYELLLRLQEVQIPCCVVTHSAFSLVQMIREQNPILKIIPNWMTREDYSQPKPHPECYQIAISRFAKIGGRVIGFEDTPRGLQALLGTAATPVLVCSPSYPYAKQIYSSRVKYYPSLAAMTDTNPP